jgi:hypothetical protein
LLTSWYVVEFEIPLQEFEILLEEIKIFCGIFNPLGGILILLKFFEISFEKLENPSGGFLKFYWRNLKPLKEFESLMKELDIPIEKLGLILEEFKSLLGEWEIC